ncbi:MAG: hypothetical protein DVB25_04035 [Verrucomicrobia bacterium]|nr:MAG: hypothetical protein DVB25_04035 [Verrucomicrobiota bacterium]
MTTATLASAQTAGYTNFIRQFQTSTAVQWDATVAASGVQLSPLPVGAGGSRFELWTVLSLPLTSYLLDTSYVGAYIPVAVVTLHSQDPYGPILRTRADHPFSVDVAVSGLLSGLTDPAASKSVNLYRYVQSYGTGGTGVNLDRSQAALLTQASITQNSTQTLSYALTSIPGADRTKVRGEERFAVFSLADYQAPAAQIASFYIQIWPVADGTLAGLSQGQLIRFAMPQISVTLNDLYPNSTTYVQTYRGNPQLGMVGKTVPGSILVLNESLPQSRVLTLKGYDAVFDSEGLWTMELLTLTPFGIDRLAYVSFNLDRIIKVNSNLTTIE